MRIIWIVGGADAREARKDDKRASRPFAPIFQRAFADRGEEVAILSETG
jgi:hypothetical protein